MFHKKKQEDEFEMVNLRTVYGVYERESLTLSLIHISEPTRHLRIKKNRTVRSSFRAEADGLLLTI